MQVGQVRDLGGDPRAAFALPGGGVAGVPHEVVGDELPAPFECFEQGERPAGPGPREAGVCLGHGQAPPGRGDRVALPGVRLLADPQLVQFGLEGGPADGRGHAGYAARSRSGRPGVLRCLLHDASMLLCQAWPANDLEPTATNHPAGDAGTSLVNSERLLCTVSRSNSILTVRSGCGTSL